MWIPLDMDGKSLGKRGSHWANAIGRLKPGVSIETARADLKLISGASGKDLSGFQRQGGRRGCSAARRPGGRLAQFSADDAFGGGPGAADRLRQRGESAAFASRGAAKGDGGAQRAGRGAGAAAAAIADRKPAAVAVRAAPWDCWWRGARSRWSRTPRALALPQFAVIQLNGEVLAFTFALAVVTGVLFGLVPALRTSRPDLHEELKGGAGSSISPGKRRRFTSNVLVVGEMALSMLLLVSAGLLLKDFARLRNLDIGVRPEGVFTAAVRLPDTQYKTAAQQLHFREALLEKCAHIAGVDAAAISDHLPLEGGSNYYVKLRGQTSQMSNLLVEHHPVTPEYFRAMGVRLLKGRLFEPADVQRGLALDARFEKLPEGGHLPTDEANAMVFPTVINESMARAFWPNRSPLGADVLAGQRSWPVEAGDRRGERRPRSGV